MNLTEPYPPQDDITRALPHAVGPEKSVISSILQDPAEYLGRATELGLRSENFYLPTARILFDAIHEIFTANKTPDLVSIVQHLLDRNQLDRAGGPSAVYDLYNYAPTSFSFAQHAAAITEKFVLREIIRVAGESIATAYDAPDAPWEALDAAEAQMLAIRDQTQPRTSQTRNSALQSILDDVQAMISGKTDEIGLKTGFATLDKLTCGLRPGQVFVIAARPSMGKSALMMNIVEHAVFNLNQPAMVFSLEMSQKELLARLLFSRSRFNPATLDGRQVVQADLLRIRAAYSAIAAAPLHIDDTPAITISEIRAKARRAKARHGVKLIAIDYMQLIRSTSKQAQNSREREIGEISAGIKALAKELNLPVIVLAQLNRESEKRSGKSKGVPRMSDLRESGTIEQDADLVGLLYREAYFAEDDDEKGEIGNVARLIISKNRNGATGDQHLAFIPELVRFEHGFPPAQVPKEPVKSTRYQR